MKKEYINRLSQNIIRLVQDIESHIDDDIDVKVDESRSCVLACEVDKQGAAILTHKHDYFPEDSVLHELLHIRRICLDKVPQLVVCDNFDNWTPELETGLKPLDNNLEHLIIVPEELKYRPDRKEYWKNRIINKIETFDDQIRVNQIQAFDTLIYRVLIHHVLKDDDLKIKIDEIISPDLKNISQEFHDKIVLYLDSKEKLVKVCFNYINISDKAVCLEYIDCKNHSSYKNSLSNIYL